MTLVTDLRTPPVGTVPQEKWIDLAFISALRQTLCFYLVAGCTSDPLPWIQVSGELLGNPFTHIGIEWHPTRMNVTMIKLAAMAILTQLVNALTTQIELPAGWGIAMAGYAIIRVPVRVWDLFILQFFFGNPFGNFLGSAQHLLPAQLGGQ
jgi:hypothetical protein